MINNYICTCIYFQFFICQNNNEVAKHPVKEITATTRLVLDSMRTIGVLTVSISVGWQIFHYLQLLGFAVLIAGMCMYNEIVPWPCGSEVIVAKGDEVIEESFHFVIMKFI